LVFKGKFAISTNALQMTWISIFGADETVYYSHWEKGPLEGLLETSSDRIGCKAF
jgi:hypothetical protein